MEVFETKGLLFYEWIKDLSREDGKVRTEKQIDSLKY